MNLKKEGDMDGWIENEEGRPVADETTFSVRWRGRTCSLGNTDGFRLIQCFIEANGRNVSHADIAEMLGNFQMESPTIRKAVSRLRERLRNSGLCELGEAIIPQRGYFRLDVSLADNKETEK